MAGGVHLTEQDKAEAACVTARGGGHQYEIQLGHLCNNRCVFCSSGQLTELKLARHVPLEPIVHAIEKARADGARRITFLGGEPTLHKGFPEAVKRAVELGFEEIVIFTNGVLLPRPGFIEKIASLGRFEWRVSIQGGNEAAHVAVTKRKDSFRRIVDGVRLLRARGEKVTANMCVNEESYRSLPDYPALAAELGLVQLHVDIVRPSSAGERSGEYLREIMPRYSAMAPFMAEMFRRFDALLPGFDVHVGNLPYCVLPEFAARIEHGGEETITEASDATGLEVAVDKYEWHASMRRHLPRCESCAFRSKCTGIFATYLELHGDDEFQPVAMDALGLPVERELEAFAKSGAKVVRLGREKRAEVTAGDVRLDFAPRDALPSPSVRTGRFDLAIDAPLTTTPTELAQALLPLAIDVAPLVDRHRRARAIARLATQLGARPMPRGFALVDTRTDDAGVALELRSADGATLEVVFVMRESAGKYGVSVSARLGPGATAAMARRVVEALAPAGQ